ncbi:MAG: hypothetical protein MUO40_04140, partial [Anaerolineaceae bacterium]|nr:hypothetical protein [Anaerolineaceae bacterium]
AGKGGGGGEVFGLGGGAADPELESAVLVPEISEEPAPEELVIGGDLSSTKVAVEEQETVIFGLNLEENETDQSSPLRSSTLLQVLRSVSVVQWVKIGLGTLALGLGITAIIFWMKKRH